MALKLEVIFECDACKKQYHSWRGIEKHLNSNPDHAPTGYGLVNIDLQITFNPEKKG